MNSPTKSMNSPRSKGQNRAAKEWFVRLMILGLGWMLGLFTASSFNNNTSNNKSSSPLMSNNNNKICPVCPPSATESLSSARNCTTATGPLQPLQHSKTPIKASYRRKTTGQLTFITDVMNPFHQYMAVLGSQDTSIFSEIPLWNSWIHYFEAYHNHMARFRHQDKVVFMEIGVQSGGKIPLLRKYFGPGLEYIGIDINPSTKMFETTVEDDFTAHIEIGDSTNITFLEEIKKKYPHVDIFLDDGGHTMKQQITAIRHFLPHVQREGVYMCEDLGTSWQKVFGGVPNGKSTDLKFLNETMVGFIHQTMDWFTSNIMRGKNSYYAQDIDAISNCKFRCDDNPENPWWKMIPKQVKHIHYYHQIVVFEKGITTKPSPLQIVGTEIPIGYSGEHKPVQWNKILNKIDGIFEVSNVEFQ